MIDEQLVKAVKEISIKAGAAILEVYNQEGAIDVASKEDNSPLTAADLAAHELITAGLKQITPALPILSEESADISWAERSSWEKYWLVDPLDGTKEFLKRNGEFTVNIALIDNHVPVLGVVYVPVKNILYFGGQGLGAYKQYEESLEKISVKTLSKNDPVKVVASRSHRGEELVAWLDKVEEAFASVELVSMGSSLKICLVAEGLADIYPRLALTSEWDTAAAQAVLEAAGGTLKDNAFNTYRYNKKEDILNPYFFAIGDVTFDWQSMNA